MTPASAHQLKLRLPAYAADVIAVKRERGADESLAAWSAPIVNALEHAPRQVENPQLVAELADCREGEAEAAYNLNPCVETARLLLRKRAVERQTSLDHDRAIAARWGISL